MNARETLEIIIVLYQCRFYTRVGTCYFWVNYVGKNIGVLQNYCRIFRKSNCADQKKKSWIHRVLLNRNRLNHSCCVDYYSVDPNTFQCKLISRNGEIVFPRIISHAVFEFSVTGTTSVGVKVRQAVWDKPIIVKCIINVFMRSVTTQEDAII